MTAPSPGAAPGKLPVIETGAGEPPTVLVPGGLVGWVSWAPHAERLSATRRVLRVQLLNVAYGIDQRPLPPGYSVVMEAEALAATMTDRGAIPADVVAWSYGAEIALSLALADPRRVRTLALIEPPAAWVLRARRTLNRDTRRVIQRLGSLGDDVTDEDLEMFAREVGFCPPGKSPREMSAWAQWSRHRLALRSSRHAIDHQDDMEAWRRFPRPVLLVKGRGSTPFLHEIIDGLAAELPAAEVLTLPGGHAPLIVAMDAFLAHLLAFQKSVAADASP